jgi:hypothetical protein
MREKQKKAELKKQGIDPDANKEEVPKKKEYDDSFLKKFECLDIEDEESKEEKKEIAEVEEEETKESKPTKK